MKTKLHPLWLSFATLVVAAAAMFLLGCGSGKYDKPGQDQAMWVVWVEQWQMTAPEPAIYWVEGQQLNCYGGAGWMLRTDPPECVAGVYHQEEDLALVAWPAGTKKISETSLAHEFCHAMDLAEGRDGDPNHTGPCFVQGGYVDQANEALRKAGL